MFLNKMVCLDCPLRLYNTKGYNISGVGNPNYGNIIILPNVDKEAYKHQNFTFEQMIVTLNSLSHSSTGVDILDYCYITPLIKCKIANSIILDDQIVKRCMENLKREILTYSPINFLLLGKDVMSHFLQYSINPDKMYVDICNRRWFNNYSPGITLYDHEKAQIFENGFIKWLNAVKSNNFSNYET